MSKHRESPVKRVNPSGEVVWVARYTNEEGKRKSAGTFKLKREAQQAIDDAYERPSVVDTVGAYFETWTERHPRGTRTNATNQHRIGRVLDVRLDGVPLRDWPFRDLRRRQANDLVAHMLKVQGRAQTGAINIIRSLSAMAEDAITDEIADVNAFKGVTVRANDPRIRGKKRPARVYSFEQMHEFAAAGGPWEPMLRVFTDTGLRLGEVLPLERADRVNGVIVVQRTAHEGEILQGTKTDHDEDSAGRIVPIPPTCEALIEAAPPRIDTRLQFPTITGKLWRESNFYRDVWRPARVAWARRNGVDVDRWLPVDGDTREERRRKRAQLRELLAATGFNIRPHDCRHSYISHLRAAGIDDADLAEMAGHTVETMLARYTHPLRRSHDQVRGLIG